MNGLNVYRSRPSSLWDFMSELENAFDSSWNQKGTGRSENRELTRFIPSVDVAEGSDHYLLSVDLPGMSEKDIKIDVHMGTLSLSGERVHEHKKENGDLKMFERSFGQFKRSFTLPTDVETEKIQARFENGVLEIFIPKTAKAQPKSVAIETSKGGLFSRLIGEKKAAKTEENH